MDLSFYPLTLEAIDQAAAESLCLFVAADERPLTGLAGLADWRLSGRLSRLLRSGMLTGDAGEAVLTPPGSRLSFHKLFLFGVGKTGQTEEELVLRVAEALRKLAQAGVHEAAMQLPSRLPVEVGIRMLIDELQGPGRALVFGPDPQKMVMALSQAASRGSAQLERRVVKVPPPPPVKQVSLPARPQRPPEPKVAPPAQPPVAAYLPAPQVAPALPKASPLPFAPQRDVPAQQLGPLTPPPPASIPKATPLPFAPLAEPLPTGPSQAAPREEQRAEAPASPPAAPLPSAATPPAGPLPAAATPPAAPLPAAATPPAAPLPGAASPPAVPAEEKRHPLPPSQRYVPPPPKPHVFESDRKKKK